MRCDINRPFVMYCVGESQWLFWPWVSGLSYDKAVNLPVRGIMANIVNLRRDCNAHKMFSVFSRRPLVALQLGIARLSKLMDCENYYWRFTLIRLASSGLILYHIAFLFASSTVNYHTYQWLAVQNRLREFSGWLDCSSWDFRT